MNSVAYSVLQNKIIEREASSNSAMPIKVNFNAHLKIYSKVPDKLALRLLILGISSRGFLFEGDMFINFDQIIFQKIWKKIEMLKLRLQMS